MQKRVTHLIVGLGKGGAETMLYQVLKYKTDPEIQYKVISLGASHYYEESIQKLGIPLVEVSIRKKPLTSLIKAYREIRGTETLCCWMYHANLIGYYLGRMAKVKKIIWCIRHSNFDSERNNKITLAINKHCAKLSKKIDLVSYNGEKSRSIHEQIGYCCKNSVVLDNGVDCDIFCPNSFAHKELCEELKIDKNRRIILSVAKNHPIKDVPNFIRAYSMLCQTHSDTVAVMCGNGIDVENEGVVTLCQNNGLTVGRDIFLLGMRHDVNHLLAACDLYVLHSAGEAFPNTLIQAMACECLCVATDVGDVRRIMVEDFLVCEPQNEKSLAHTIECALRLEKETQVRILQTNRKKVIETFCIQNVIKKYEELYNEP